MRAAWFSALLKFCKKEPVTVAKTSKTPETAPASAEELMKKYDRESNTRIW
jgi:hypothetical protein